MPIDANDRITVDVLDGQVIVGAHEWIHFAETNLQKALLHPLVIMHDILNQYPRIFEFVICALDEDISDV